MGTKEVNSLVTDLDRKIDMSLGGKTENIKLIVRVPRQPSLWVFGKESARHVLPLEELEGANMVEINGVVPIGRRTNKVA